MLGTWNSSDAKLSAWTINATKQLPFWPEAFASNGGENTLVRTISAHRGLTCENAIRLELKKYLQYGENTRNR
jgi:hypothetical protein